VAHLLRRDGGFLRVHVGRTLGTTGRVERRGADGTLYAGCYVNAIVDIWAQDNQFGKRINAKLLVVRKKKDGEPIGAGRTNAKAEDFDFDEYNEDEVVL
jgi:hypothetical protein